MTMFVDTHCHLDAYPDPDRVLAQAAETVVVAVTELPSRYRLLATRFPKHPRLRVALGLHPLHAHDAGPLEVGTLVRLLGSVDYLGEVGLDFSRHGQQTRRAQLAVFDRLLAQPEIAYKVVTVHSRGAEEEVIARLRAASLRAILHWYTGPLRLIDEAVAAGLYVSVNPAMLRTAKGRALLSALPAERVLTESDGPYAKLGGRQAMPRDMPRIIQALANAWDVTIIDAQRRVYDNMAELYRVTVGAK